VLVSLVAAMTIVGGGLTLLDRGPVASPQGLALPPLLATAGQGGIESIFSTRKPLDTQRWQAIVIHDTGTMAATPASLEAQAVDAGLNGLGYHFVIGNGNGLDDGEIHVGGRWLRQAPGAHAVGPDHEFYNRHSIGISLVGDGERRPFTPAQMQRLVQLVETLQDELKISGDRVMLHSQIAQTPSPGKLFPEAIFRQLLSQR
jgi:N-acetyl-anhydromuramyl-L-alanine amidase AmpD